MEKRPIRILHVIGSMNYGGAETLIMSLFRQIDRSRVQFDFVENTMAPAAFDDEIRSLGGRIFNCPHYNGENHFAYTQWWKRFFEEHSEEFKAVHGHLGSTAAIYLRIAKKYGLFTIAHSHNTRGVGFRDFLYRMYSFPTRFVADQFFACSLSAGIDRYGKRIGTDPNRCHVIHNVIDTKRFSYDPQMRNAGRSMLDIPDNELVIGHVGRFTQQKNHTFLIDVFFEVHKRNPNTRLLLIGKGEAEQSARKKVDALGLSDFVIFAGTHANTELYYHVMDLFVLPSLFEGFGIVSIEAQCSGLPCVISDKVSAESVLAQDLVSICKLSDSASDWASVLLSVPVQNRFDHSAIIAAKGYDTKQTADSLADYYCFKVNLP